MNTQQALVRFVKFPCLLLLFSTALTAQMPGSVDLSFETSIPPQPATEIRLMALQANGSILVSGDFTTARLIRLHADGSTDAGFVPQRFADVPISSLAVQADQKVLIGMKLSFGQTLPRHIDRLLPDGESDASFQPGNAPNLYVHSIAIQPDQKILISGEFFEYNGVHRYGIARIHPDGSLDTSFTPAPGPANFIPYIRSVGVMPDGKILYLTLGGTLHLLHPDGTTDTSFSPAPQPNGFGSFYIQTDGKIMTNTIRLHPDGSLDHSYQFPDFSSLGYIIRIEPLGQTRTGNTVVFIEYQLPNSTQKNYRVYQLRHDGAIDTNYPPLTFNGRVNSMAQPDDEHLLLAGSFNLVNDIYKPKVVRIHLAPAVSVSQAVLNSPAQLYPNPASDRLVVQWPDHKVRHFRIYDISGRQIRPAFLQSTALTEIDVSSLLSGLYFLHVIAEDGHSSTFKWMKL